MSPAPADRLGPYEVIRELGRGGMGVVYLARDPRLDRNVAIKALPPHLAQDPDRLARFEREAKILAQLNHSNVAGIYGIEEHERARYLVLEYVEGETLAARLDRGALPFDEALEIAVQIATGVEAAHEAGVIHRDLKPGNVIVTPQGNVKVLDFGLARSEESSSSTSGSPTAPTITSPAIHSPTMPGVILGTAAYMSPEQARGRPVDKRTDIWSFGVILYEMLAGVSPFRGETVTDSIGAVLHKDLDFSRLSIANRPDIYRVLSRCIHRDLKQRYRDIGDVRLDLLSERRAPIGQGLRQRSSLLVTSLLLVGLVAGGLSATLILRTRASDSSDAPAPLVERFEVPFLSEADSFLHAPTISPNGRAVAYMLDGKLWIRPIDSFEPTPVDGGDGAVVAVWSPDSSRLAFAKGSELWKVDAQGRRAQLIGPTPDQMGTVSGAAWLEDGRILFTTGNGGLYEIRATGGPVRLVLSQPPGILDFHEIEALPNSKNVLITLHPEAGPFFIAVWDGTTVRKITALENGANYASRPVYAPSGHLLYEIREPNGGIWAARFSLDSLDVIGAPFKVAHGARFPSVDAHGTLLYCRDRAEGTYQLVRIDRDSGEASLFKEREAESLADPDFSADGSSMLYVRTDEPGRDVWLEETGTGSRTRLTFTKGENWYPTMSPDGSRVATAEEVFDPPGWALRFYATDGSGPSGESIEVHDRMSFDREWKTVVFDRRSDSTDIDIWAWDLVPDHEPRPVIDEEGGQSKPALSPDGAWLLFVQRGQEGERVFLTQFPETTARWQVSEEYGAMPRWTPDARAIVYVTAEGGLNIVDVKLEPRVQIGRPRPLIPGRSAGYDAFNGCAFHPASGDVVVPREIAAGSRQKSIAIVKNWALEFEK